MTVLFVVLRIRNDLINMKAPLLVDAYTIKKKEKIERHDEKVISHLSSYRLRADTLVQSRRIHTIVIA